VGWDDDQISLKGLNSRYYFIDNFAGADHELVRNLVEQCRLSVLLEAEPFARFQAVFQAYLGDDSQHVEFRVVLLGDAPAELERFMIQLIRINRTQNSFEERVHFQPHEERGKLQLLDSDSYIAPKVAGDERDDLLDGWSCMQRRRLSLKGNIVANALTGSRLKRSAVERGGLLIS